MEERSEGDGGGGKLSLLLLPHCAELCGGAKGKATYLSSQLPPPPSPAFTGAPLICNRSAVTWQLDSLGDPNACMGDFSGRSDVESRAAGK